MNRPVWDWLLPLLAAPFVGSFLGVLIRRLPQGRPVVLARSACEGCGAVLAPRDMVPLVSHLALHGRCRRCGAPIDRFHVAIELAAILVPLSALAAGAVPEDMALVPWLWAGCGLGWTLLALGWIDARHMRLPDALTLPLLLAGLAATWWLDPPNLTDHAIGAAAGYLGFRGLAALYRALRKRDGLGQGDAKLLAAAGAWVGWQGLASVVLIAALAGLGVALGLRAAGRRLDRGTALPFGPCLALGLWVVWLLGPLFG